MAEAAVAPSLTSSLAVMMAPVLAAGALAWCLLMASKAHSAVASSMLRSSAGSWCDASQRRANL